MSVNTKRSRDVFTFSLGGLKTITSFVAAPAIAHDRINNALDEQLRHAQEDQPDTAREIGAGWGRFWLRARRRAA